MLNAVVKQQEITERAKHLPRTGCIWDEQRLGIGYPIKCIESESWLIDENWMFPISALQYQIGFPFPHLTRHSGGISNADFPKLICPCAWKPRGNMSSYFQPLSFKGYVGYIEKVWASVQVSLVSDSKNLSPWPEETVIDPQETVCKCVCLKWLSTSQWMTEM